MKFVFVHAGGQEVTVEADDDAAAWPALKKALNSNAPVTKLMQVWGQKVEAPPETPWITLPKPTGEFVPITSDEERPRWLAFQKFHYENPHVWELFQKFAREMVGRGRFGARMIWERIRWYAMVETQTKDEWKFNDHSLPYYARMFMLSDPAHAGLFETRDARFDATEEELQALLKATEET